MADDTNPGNAPEKKKKSAPVKGKTEKPAEKPAAKGKVKALPTKGGGAARTRTPLFPLEAKLSGVAKEHPFRGVREAEFSCMKNGMTVAQYLEALRACEAVPVASLGLLKIAVEKGLVTVK